MFPTRRIITSGGDVYRDQYSLEFDGTGDYITVPNTSSLNIAGDMSCVFWMKRTDSPTTDDLVVKRDGGGTNYQFDISDDDKVRAFDGSTTATATGAITLNEWTHIAFSIDSGTATAIYINGVQDATTTALTITADDADLTIGHNVTGSVYWQGNISEVAIWNTALSSGQVKQLYNGREPFDARNVAKSNLVSYWRMGDGVLDDKRLNGLVADQVNATLGSEKVVNGDMEIEDNWVNFSSPDVNSQSDEQFYSTGNSRKIITTGNQGIKQTGISLITGKLHKITYWVYPVGNTTIGTALNDGTWLLDVTTSGLTADTWNEVTHYVKATNSTAYIIINDRAAATGTWYIDDVSIKEINGNPGVLVNLNENNFKTDVPR